MKPEYLIYFWTGSEVEIVSVSPYSWKPKSTGMPCVDTRSDEPEYRYGMWRADSKGWIAIPLTEFPNEFKLQLLLLGVT